MPTMPPLPGSWDRLDENTPTLLEPLPGGVPVSIWCYPAAFRAQQPSEEVHTIQFDFISPFRISPELAKEGIDHIAPKFIEGGEEVAFYFLWEKQEFDISIPEQFCFFGHCWTPPWAGNTLLVVYRYRLWIVSRQPIVSPLVRPWIVAVAIIVLIALLIVPWSISGVIAFREGKISYRQLTEGVKDIIKAPGENIKAAMSPLTWAGLGLGVVLVGMAIALPYLQPRMTVTAPIGPARVTAGVSPGRAR